MPDAARRFQPDRHGLQELRATGALRLRQRKGRGDYRDAGMTDMPEIGIVMVQRMTCGTVGQWAARRGLTTAEPPRPPQRRS